MVAPVLIGAGIGAGLGLLKTRSDQEETERMNRAQAELTRYSPWTGMKGQMQSSPSMFGGITQGAALGAMAGGMMPASPAVGAGAGSGVAAGSGAAPKIGTGLASSPAQQSAFNEAAMQAGTSQAPQQAAQGASMFAGIPGLDQNAPNYTRMGQAAQSGGQLPQGSKWASMQQPGYGQRQF